MSPNSKIPRSIKNTDLLRSMAKRRDIDLKTTSNKYNSKSQALENRSRERVGKLGKGHINTSKAIIGKPVEIPLEDPDKPSTYLGWRPKGIIRKILYIPGKIRRFFYTLFPALTLEEKETKEYINKYNKDNLFCAREGRNYCKRVSIILADLHNNHNQLLRWNMITRDEPFSKIVLSVNLNPKYLPVYMILTRIRKDPIFTDNLATMLSRPVLWNVGDYGATLSIILSDPEPERYKRITVEDLIG
jgi:hypothetical protein